MMSWLTGTRFSDSQAIALVQERLLLDKALHFVLNKARNEHIVEFFTPRSFKFRRELVAFFENDFDEVRLYFFKRGSTLIRSLVL